MKKCFCILLAAMMILAFACAAAEGTPEPASGKKFNHDWASPDAVVRICYEEEGYRVQITLERPGEAAGSVWEYACLYQEDTDSLVSVSSSRTDYTVSPDDGEQVFSAAAYDDLDGEDTCTVFTVEGGKLAWKNGRKDSPEGLAFTDIGRFEGVWKNEAEETEAEFSWNSFDPDKFSYTVYITRGLVGSHQYALYLMDGTYDPATGKLTAYGSVTAFVKNADGEYESDDDGETYDAIFSMMDDGRLLYETANGIELEYDLLGGSAG